MYNISVLEVYLDLWLMFSREVNLDLSANITSHKFRVPLLCLEIIATFGDGLYLLLFLAFFLSGLFGRGDLVEPKK